MHSYFIRRCEVSNNDKVDGTESVFMIKLNYKIIRVKFGGKIISLQRVTRLASMVHQLST